MRWFLASLFLLTFSSGDLFAQILRQRAARVGVCNVSTCAVQVQEVVQVQQVAVVQQVQYVPVFVSQAIFTDPRISYQYLGGAYYPPQQTLAQMPAQSAIQPKVSAAPARTEMDAMNARMDKIEAALQKLLDGKSEGVPPPTPPRVPGFEKVSYTPKAAGRTHVDVLITNCAECHSRQTKGNNLVMFPAPGQLAPGLDYDSIWKAISEGRMPPAIRPRVTDGDRRILEADFGLSRS